MARSLQRLPLCSIPLGLIRLGQGSAGPAPSSWSFQDEEHVAVSGEMVLGEGVKSCALACSAPTTLSLASFPFGFS